jgi:hypothetical protein
MRRMWHVRFDPLRTAVAVASCSLAVVACGSATPAPPNGGTIPLVTTEASLAFAENGWNFGVVTSPAQINQQMVAGACSHSGG